MGEEWAAATRWPFFTSHAEPELAAATSKGRIAEFVDYGWDTSQMIDPRGRTWAYELVRAFGLPERILGTLVQPGTILGLMRPALATETGVRALKLSFLLGGHPTDDAVRPQLDEIF